MPKLKKILKLVRKKYKKTVLWLFKQSTIVIIIFLCGLIVFHEPIENLLSKTVVEYILSYCKSSLPNNYIFSFLAVFLILYAYFRRKAVIANNSILILLVVSGFYIYYRSNEHVWKFTPFLNLSHIKYADILLLVPALLLIRWAIRPSKGKKGKENVSSFFNDEPLDKNSPDDLGYKTFAKTIAEKIEATKLDKAFAIGVNAKWGMGKTSFFNLIKNNLSSEENIIIDFNSWNSSSPKAIIQDFFDTLQEELRPYYSSLAQEIRKYSDKLTALTDNSITQSLKATTGILIGETSISGLHQEINDKLKRIDKRIIIFVDDLDRLDKSEIIEVMRLIRNTANFYNTIFLVAYDRDYALLAINEYNPHNFQSFLEKIFQLEINLPYYEPNVIRERLSKNLKELLSKQMHGTVEHTLFNKGYRNREEINLHYWISNIRDVTRLSNSISVTMQKLHEEVYFKDFLYLQILRLKFPNVFEHISKNFHNYFITFQAHNYKQQYTLKTLDKEGKFKYELEIYLHKNSQALYLDEESIQNIINLLFHLFNRHTYDFYGNQDHLSVVHPLHYRKYFAYNLGASSISEVEFTKARASSQENFNNKIKEYVLSGKDVMLRFRFMDIRSFDSKEDFEKVIKGIFFFANQEIQNSINYFKKVGYDTTDLKDKLSDSNYSISKKLYDSKSQSQDYKTFLYNLLNDANYPFVFESSIIGEWLKDPSDNLPLSRDELREIVINLFDKYCKLSERLDDYLWGFLSDCKIITFVDGNEIEIIPERVKIIFKNFIIQKDIDGLLHDLILIKRREEGRYTLNNSILELWDSREDFINMLEENKHKDWKYIAEFMEFYKQLNSVGIGTSIKFNFKTIPVGN